VAYRWKGPVLKRGLFWGISCALLLWLGLKLWPNDERLIRKQLAALAQTASIRPKESALARLANANKLVEFFTPDVTAQIEGTDIAVNDRKDLREAVLAAQANLHQADIHLVDIHIRFPPEKSPAIVYLTAVAHLDGQTNAFAGDLKLTLKKVERQWLIFRVESLSLGE